ncbi:hypothetical protein IH979_01780, partial [Patescibacteria group bacterium]|nr:hypothetical protein [Patescibacteria group bacterium]
LGRSQPDGIGLLVARLEYESYAVAVPTAEPRGPSLHVRLAFRSDQLDEFVYLPFGGWFRGLGNLEGKRIFSGRYASSINIWLRGLLRHRHGVDTSKLCCVVTSHGVFPPENPESTIELAADPKKSGIDSLLDGEVDAIMSDISDVKLFEQLESHPDIRR